MMACRGSWGIVWPLPNLDTLGRCVVSLTSYLLYSWGRQTQDPLNGWLGGLQSQSGHSEEEKMNTDHNWIALPSTKHQYYKNPFSFFQSWSMWTDTVFLVCFLHTLCTLYKGHRNWYLFLFCLQDSAARYYQKAQWEIRTLGRTSRLLLYKNLLLIVISSMWGLIWWLWYLLLLVAAG